MMKNITSIIVRIGDNGPSKELKGRLAWALTQLVTAGNLGCTAIEHPGPRWSDYVFKLKREGIAIETVTEMHGGAYAGHHARYVLRSPVTVISEVIHG